MTKTQLINALLDLDPYQTKTDLLKHAKADLEVALSFCLEQQEPTDEPTDLNP